MDQLYETDGIITCNAPWLLTKIHSISKIRIHSMNLSTKTDHVLRGTTELTTD